MLCDILICIRVSRACSQTKAVDGFWCIRIHNKWLHAGVWLLGLENLQLHRFVAQDCQNFPQIRLQKPSTENYWALESLFIELPSVFIEDPWKFYFEFINIGLKILNVWLFKLLCFLAFVNYDNNSIDLSGATVLWKTTLKQVVELWLVKLVIVLC